MEKLRECFVCGRQRLTPNEYTECAECTEFTRLMHGRCGLCQAPFQGNSRAYAGTMQSGGRVWAGDCCKSQLAEIVIDFDRPHGGEGDVDVLEAVHVFDRLFGAGTAANYPNLVEDYREMGETERTAFVAMVIKIASWSPKRRKLWARLLNADGYPDMAALLRHIRKPKLDS